MEGSLGITGSLIVDGLFSGAPGSDISITGGGGDEVRVGQVCVSGPIVCDLPMTVDGTGTDLIFDLPPNVWTEDIRIDVDGRITLMGDLLFGNDPGDDLLLQGGTFAVQGDPMDPSTAIDVGGEILVTDLDALGPIAILDIGGEVVEVPAPDSITVGNRGKLNIGAGGVLQLGANTLTVESGGTLCLDGDADDRATLTGSAGNRYTLDLLSGSTIAAKNFVLEFMSAAGIVVDDDVTIAPPLLDLRGGRFDHPDPIGVLLDIRRRPRRCATSSSRTAPARRVRRRSTCAR